MILTILVLSVLIIAFTMVLMAVGLIFKNKILRRGCGGDGILDQNGEMIGCGTGCACREEWLSQKKELNPVVK